MIQQRDDSERERRRLPVAERLEPRVLYSADALGGLAALLDEPVADEELAAAREALLWHARLDAPPAGDDGERVFEGAVGETTDERGDGAAAPGEAIGANHVVFVDAAVPDAGALSAALADSGATVVTIDGDEDGLLAISRTLAGRDALAAVHIVSHGAPGSLALGATTLDETTLASNGAGIARWGDALRAGGDVLVYGCDAGAGEIGKRFVNALATLTGADVAASDDATGHAALGGDWQLERTSGVIESAGVDEAFAAGGWRHLLDTITIAFQGDGLNVAADTTMAELDALQGGGQDVTLREAFRAAAIDPGADTIVLGAGTWTLDLSGDDDDLNTSGDLDVLETLTVQGAGSGVTTIEMSAADKDRLFDVHSGWALTLEGVTVRGGEASDDGGAIRVLAGGTLVARDVVIEDSESLSENGGGIYNDGDTTLEDVVVRNNTAAKSGGGIFSDNGAQLALADVSIIGNEAVSNHGGGIETKESLGATDLVMRDNIAAQDGGALHAEQDVTITGGSFTNNSTSGENGGAIEVHGAFTVTDAQFSNNSAAKGGGALWLKGISVLERVTLDGNVAGTLGGGLGLEHAGDSLTLTGVTFSGNRAEDGGALYVRGDAEIVNSTFVDNRDDSSGGAIYKQGGGEVRVRNSVFAGNLTAGVETTSFGTVVSDGFNVFSDTPVFGYVGADSDLVATDARLLPLADNGGSVPTHATADDSPLINAGGGGAPVTDASGQTVDAVPDIGAYESRTAANVVWLVDDTGKLLRAPSDMSSVQVLLDGLTMPSDVAVDIGGGRLYWLETAGAQLSVADLDGANRQTFGVVGQPAVSIAIDTVNGYLLAARGVGLGISSIDRVPLANLTAPMTNVVSSGLHTPRAIEVRGSGEVGDPVRVYWAEQGGGGVTRAIRSAEADTGADVATHIDSATGIVDFDTGDFIDLAVSDDADDFFWTDASRDRVVGYSVSDGVDVVRDVPTVEPSSIALLDAQERVIYSVDGLKRVTVVDEDLSSNFSSSGVDNEIRGLDTARTVVAGANNPPTGITLDAATVAENATGAVIGQLTTSDPDAGDTASYAVIGDARFEVDGDELKLAAGQSLDFESVPGGTIDVDVEVTDAGGATMTETFTVTVTDANETPTGITLDAATVAENAAGAVIGRLTTSDPDAGDTASYAVIGDARFEVDGDELKLAAGTSLDFEAVPGGTIDVEVEVTDAGGETTSETFTITVTDANETPTGITLDAATVAENAAGSTIGRLTTSDPDAGDTASYAVIGDARFEVDGDELKLAAGTSLDFEAVPGGTIDVDVEVTDAGGATMTETFTVTVTDANETPTGITLDAATVAENAAGSTIGRLTTSDPDAGDTASYAVIGDARFEVDGDELKLAAGTSLDFEAVPGGSVDVDVEVTDAGGETTSETFTITVTDANEAPTAIGTLADQRASTGQPFILTLSTAAWSDPDAGDTLTLVVREQGGGPLPAWLAFDPASGELTGTPPVGALGELRLEVVASDPDGLSAPPLDLLVDVVDGNTAPTAVALDVSTVAENAPGATIGRLTTSDPDVGDTVGYTVSDARFAIVGDELRLAVGQSLDFEATSSVDVEVVATDSGGASRRETFTVTVTDANETPTAIALDVSTVAENAPGATIGRLTTSDPDAGDTASYAVSDARFTIVGDELRLAVGQSLDFEATPSVAVEVVATDAGGATASETFTVTVTDANETPTAIALDVSTVAENAPGATIGRLTTSDPDAGDTASYAVSDARFAIVGDELRLAVGQSLDFEATPSVAVEVVATDSGGATASETFTVTVTDANETPTAIALDVSTVAENAPGATIGRLTTSDPDAGDTASYAVSDARFTIVGDELRLAVGQSLDFEATPSVAVEVVATDAGGATASETFTVTVTDANETPTAIALDVSTVAENAPGATIGRLTTSDPDVGDTVGYTVSDARFTIVGDELRLAVGQSLDFEATPSVAVEVVATDAGGATASETFTVTVTDANETPTAIALDAATVAENAPGATIGRLTTSDPDVGDTVGYTVSDARFTIVGDELRLAVGQSLDFEATPSVAVEVVATDAGGATASETFTVTVTDANETPTAIALDAATVAENAPGATIGRLTTSDPDVGDTVGYTVSDARFTIVGDELRLAVGQSLDFEATPSVAVEVVATDAGGATASETFTVTVTDANETPAAIALDAATVAENAPGATIGRLTTSDPDAGDTASYAVSDARFAIVGDELRLAVGQSLDFEATPSVDVEVVATDSGGATASETFTVTVTDANETPTAIALDAATVAENAPGATIGRLTTSDPDVGDTVGYTVSDARFAIVGDELRLAVGQSLDFEATPSVAVEVVATDAGGATASETFTVTVTDANETPAAIALDAATVAENAPGATIGRLTTSDPDAGDTASYAVSDARFAIVGDELRLAVGQSLDFEATPSVDVEVVATDSGGATASETFTVTVTDANETPTAIALDAATVAENAPGATIGRLTTSDPDVGDTVGYTVSDARFAIVGDELRLAVGQSLDFEATPSVDVEVVATDSGGASRRETFTLTVTDANDAPVAALPPPDVTLGPNGSYTLPVDAFSDPDGDPLVVTAALLPDWAGFESASRTFTVIDADAAAVEPAGAAARLVAVDGRGGTAALDVTLRYEPDEAVPPLAREDRFALREGDTLVVDDEVRSLLANDTVDEARAPLSALLVDGPSHGTLTLADDGTFRYEHGGGEQLVDSFRYRVSDGSGALSAPVEVTLVIEPINDVPLLVRDIGTQTVREGETLALVVDASNWFDPDAGDSVSVAVETADGGPLPAWLVYDAERGVLAGTPARDDVGTLELRFVARDASGAAALPLDVRLDVVNVNGPPDGITLTSEGLPENAFGAFVGQLSASDPDIGDTARFTTTDARFAISGDRLSLSAGTALDFETSPLVTVEVTATDQDGATITRALDIRVLDANDAPVLTALEQPAESAQALRYVVPDTAFVDADGDALSYRATRVDGEPLPAWLAFDAESRAFTIISPAETVDAELTVDVRLSVEDGRGGVAFADLTFRRALAPALGPAEPAPEQVAPLAEPIVTTLAPPTAPSVAVPTGTPVATEAPPDGGESESPRDTAQSPTSGESSTPLVVDRLAAVTVDLHALLAGVERERGALELIDVSAAIELGLTSDAGLDSQTDIDTIDLGALLNDSAPLARRTFGDLADTLDAERDELDQRAALARTLIGGSAGVTSGLSVGYLLWLIRGGTLMGSVLSSLPAWRFVDPLPVLGSLADGVDADGDGESLETLVEGRPETRA